MNIRRDLSFIFLLVLAAAQTAGAEPLDEQENTPWFEGDHAFPYLESGALGEGPPGSQEETREWTHRFPIWGQQVVELGYELPLPYGVGMLAMQIEQDIELSNLQVGFNGQAPDPVDFVTFGVGQARHQTVQTKADLWLFPFMNVFLAVGHIDGRSKIPLSFPGDDALKLLLPALGGLCDRQPGFPGRPEACDQVFDVLAEPGFTGESLAAGTNLAMGWKQYFVTVNATYAISGINLVNEEIRTWTGAIRAGVLSQTRRGNLAYYLGAMYLDVEIDLSGQLVLPTGADPAIGQDLSLDFAITQKNADPWNAVAGLSWDFSERLNVNVEAGFGGSRSHAMAGVTWRF